MASGATGILVGFLKIYPTDIELAGLKFHSPDLPITAIVALGVVISYFLIKFFLSYKYEQSDREMQKIADQILKGKAAIDIARVEQEVRDLTRHVTEQREKAMKEREQNDKWFPEEERRINEKTVAEYERIMQTLEKEEHDATENLDKLLMENDDGIHTKYGDDLFKESKQFHLDSLAKIPNRRAEAQVNRDKDLETKLTHLENDKARRLSTHDAIVRELNEKGEEIISKTKFIADWKQVHRTARFVSPAYEFIEFHFPLLVGLVAIGFLAWLGFHPPLPQPILLPGF